MPGHCVLRRALVGSKWMEGDAPAIQQPPNHPSPLVQWAEDSEPMYTAIDRSVGMHNGQLALYTLSAVGK